jgi:hypothetical protein
MDGCTFFFIYEQAVVALSNINSWVVVQADECAFNGRKCLSNQANCAWALIFGPVLPQRSWDT